MSSCCGAPAGEGCACELPPPPNDLGEVRVTSATGGQKGKKQAQVGALDPQAILEVAKVAGFGAEKYERYNFLRGYDWSLAFDAMQRHALAYWGGEDNDPESGLSHMAHVGWHALALIAFAQRGIGTDDRPVRQAPGFNPTDIAIMASALGYRR